ncbi:unnamed protein product [Gongylonema pulchrum]|uniref:Ras-associating domain-containing protein n=1 Tax=Gongylonema pulchrum TaxID=637853 RepID=A0A183D5E5_9BILA|nr:unnamed protein product [Gongylonema pulchrum]
MWLILKHEDEESNEFDLCRAPRLVREMYHHNPQLTELVQPKEEAAPSEEANEAAAATCSVPAVDTVKQETETTSACEARTSSLPGTPKSTSMKEDEQVQLRRQIVSVGKQPKAQPARRKKDMVCCSHL